MTGGTHRDPRSIITPDAFDVSADLVGMPLALPRQRAMALAIDGLVIGVITLVTKSFALILGVVAAAFFVRSGFRRTQVRGSVFGRAMRFSVGCLGVVIGVVTAIVWVSTGIGSGSDGDEMDFAQDTSDPVGLVGDALESMGLIQDLENAGSITEAEAIARDLAAAMEGVGLDRATIRDALIEPVSAAADWSDDWETRVDLLLDDTATPEPPGVLAGSDLAEIAGYTDREALTAYAALIGAEGDTGPENGADAAGGPSEALVLRRAALEARLVALVGGDTLRALNRRFGALERTVEDRDRELRQAREDLDEATGGGVVGWVFARLDDLGFGFGWAALYMTVFLSWWDGQTVGKKALGIRVVRLDGEPITWWVAFERAGGYAAGLATGLLGFAQIWWDANRQAIHDRIVGTVVVVDKAAKVTDWESAL